MRFPRLFPASALLLLLVPLVGADAAPPAPQGVVALSVSPVANEVSWIPEAAAESYNVYGLTVTGWTLIASTTNTETLVLGAGYLSFQVTAIASGMESAPAQVDGFCIYPILNPPPPTVHFDGCGSSAFGVMVGVRLP